MKPIPQFLERCRLSVFLLALGPLFSARTPAQTAESYRQRAIELSRAKLWDEAIASYHQALELAPDDAQTHYNLALALKYKGDNRQTVVRFFPFWFQPQGGLEFVNGLPVVALILQGARPAAVSVCLFGLA